MNKSQKEIIAKLLRQYVDLYDSQSKAVQSLKEVSEATVINILKCKWEGIADGMWRKVGKQVGYSPRGEWNTVPIKALTEMTGLLNLAKAYSNVLAVTAPAGTGKSHASEIFKKNNKDVYHIKCSEFFNRKTMLWKILEEMGYKSFSGNVNMMMDTIISEILTGDSPLIILDEVDKLNDQALHFFITLYNMLEGKCGIVLCATDYFRRRIERGRMLGKKGYEEIWSRLGRKFINLHQATQDEVEMICQANGVSEATNISTIYNELWEYPPGGGKTQVYSGDLRRVERSILRLTMVE